MLSGTWGTTHKVKSWCGSEAYGLQHNLIIQSHHQIKDNMPITNMQIALGSISRVQSTTNYEGDEVNLGDGDGADVDDDEDASPHA